MLMLDLLKLHKNASIPAVLLLMGLAGCVSEWVLESKYPPESYYARVAVVGNDVYFFSDTAQAFQYLTALPMDRYWVLNSDSLQWRSGRANGDLPKKRDLYCLGTIGNLIFMFGGIDDTESYFRDLNVFNTGDESWTLIVPLNDGPSARSRHTCFSWRNRFYVYGGSSASYNTDLWEFDPGTLMWRQVRYKNQAPILGDVQGQIHNNRLYIFGGCDLERCHSNLWTYDMVTSIWNMEAGFLESENTYYNSIAILGNKLFSFGGVSNRNDKTIETDYLKVINLETKELQQQQHTRLKDDVEYPIARPTARSDAATFVAGGKLFVLGGYGSNGLNDFWVLDPVTLEWTDSSLSRYPIAREDARITLISDHQFVMFGGTIYLYDAQDINDLWTFDTEKRQWNRLSQETPCTASNSSCMPSVYLPSVGFWNGILFFIGGEMWTSVVTTPIARTFSLATMKWSRLITSPIFLDAAGRLFGSQFAVLGSQLHIWSGRISATSRRSNDLAILDMETLSASVMPSKNSWPSARFGGSGFAWNSSFCAHGGQLSPSQLISSDIWCYESGVWVQKANSTGNKLAGLWGSVEVVGAPLVFGGQSFQDSGFFSSIFYDGSWFPIASRDIWPVGQEYLASARISSKVFIFSGKDYDTDIRTSLIYSFDFANTFCSTLTRVSGAKGLIQDGSNLVGYLPGTNCVWESFGANAIQVSMVGLREKARLSFETSTSCEAKISVDGKEYAKVEIGKDHVGKIFRFSSGRFRVRFNVEPDAPMGDGFELEYFTCPLGFVANGTNCYCPLHSFVSFRGECVSCPPNMKQSETDQKVCLEIEPQSAEQDTTTDRVVDIIPGQVKRLGYHPLPTLDARATYIAGKIVVVGGKMGSGDGEVIDFALMDRIHILSSAVHGEWILLNTTGDIPAPRSKHCFVGVDSLGILFGGEASKQDGYVYHLDVQRQKWVRKGAVPFLRKGAVCTEWNSAVLVYGGQEQSGVVRRDLWIYEPGIDSWRLLSDSDTNPPIANSVGVVVDNSLVIYSGSDGQNEHNSVHTISLDSFTVTRIEISISECLECDSESGACFFGRQDFSMGALGRELHIYGGTSRGQPLHDILVYSMESKRIETRKNYEWDVPALPLQYPPPKHRAAFVSVDHSLLIIGGSAKAGFASADTWTWDMDLKTWSDSSIVRRPIQRGGAAIVKTDQHKFAIFGGRTLLSEDVYLNDLWEFDMDKKLWRNLFRESEDNNAPAPRVKAGIGYINGTFFMMGGQTYMNVADDRLWMFSIVTRKWTFSPLGDVGRNFRPLLRVGSMHIQMGEDMFVYGGQISNGLRGLERYSPILKVELQDKKSIRTMPSGDLPEPRRHACISAINDHLVIMIGGQSFDGQILDDAWKLDTVKMEWYRLSSSDLGVLQSGGVAQCTAVAFEQITILHGGYTSKGISSAAFMIQHGFNATVPLFFETLPGFGAFSEHASIRIDNHVVMFGGTSDFALSSDVYAFRPGLCSTQGIEIDSFFETRNFDDGSNQGNYLASTNCRWLLPNATHLSVSHELRSDDNIVILEYAKYFEGNTKPLLDGHGIGSKETVIRSESGFVVLLQAKDFGHSEPGPCEECKGFEISHAACPPNAQYVNKVCACEAGYFMQNQICKPCEATSLNAACPFVPPKTQNEQDKEPVLIGASVGGAIGLAMFAFVAVLYRRHIQQVSGLKKKLYGQILFEELSFQELIGSGAFGEVYRGEWRGADVAIKKLIRKDIDTQALSAFMAEVSAMVELRHPNILLFMGASVDPPNLCLVCELMVGNLFDLLQNRDVVITLNQRTRFMLDIAKGMQYLHSANPPILHRDLKSLNILLDERWHAKVSDFGLTIKADENKADENVGSLLWLSPEVIMGQEYKACADVYSYGIIVWEIITRKIPFEGADNPFGVAMQVALTNLRPPIEGLSIPPLISQVIEACWAADPSARPTFVQVVRDIQGLKEMSGSKNSSLSSFQREMDTGPNYPVGDVCFVLWQLAGADDLWETMPDAIADALQLHNDAMRSALSMNHGVLVRNEGDSFMAVFQNMNEGVK
eukprot:TRINITY_DN1025_c0_g1_i12.p1 TRINITY_DN1025_c0_g1~~TRINITY_DN1025_c0_g1_i12.p1  ORF type:complete len:2045 (+),score=374.67 TRINITY_DN1025_c0_g1_i12:132-6266(+)